MTNVTLLFAELISSDYLPKTTSDSFGTILNVALATFGAIGVLVVVYSGIQMIISQGNAEKVAQARRGIIYAVAGLVIIFFAQIIVQLIYNKTS